MEKKKNGEENEKKWRTGAARERKTKQTDAEVAAMQKVKLDDWMTILNCHKLVQSFPRFIFMNFPM